MLVLRLKGLGNVRGIYGPKKDLFPARAAYLHPEAADAFIELEKEMGPLVYSDILRGPDESLAAAKSGRGAQPPGFSGHNFGLAFDLAVDQVMREKKWRYGDMITIFEAYGFYPYRQDRSRGHEEWHFNYLGEHASDIRRLTSARNKWQLAAELMIRRMYPAITLTASECQAALKSCGMYSGNVDGQFGFLSRTAATVFCQAWGLPTTDPLKNERFMRTLAFVTAKKEVVT